MSSTGSTSSGPAEVTNDGGGKKESEACLIQSSADASLNNSIARKSSVSTNKISGQMGTGIEDPNLTSKVIDNVADEKENEIAPENDGAYSGDRHGAGSLSLLLYKSENGIQKPDRSDPAMRKTHGNATAISDVKPVTAEANGSAQSSRNSTENAALGRKTQDIFNSGAPAPAKTQGLSAAGEDKSSFKPQGSKNSTGTGPNKLQPAALSPMSMSPTGAGSTQAPITPTPGKVFAIKVPKKEGTAANGSAKASANSANKAASPEKKPKKKPNRRTENSALSSAYSSAGTTGFNSSAVSSDDDDDDKSSSKKSKSKNNSQQGQTAKKVKKEDKASTEENNKWWRLTLRQKANWIFLILEAFLIQNIFFIIAKYQYSVYTIMVETTKKELGLMATTYSTKVEQMAYGFQGGAQNGAINDLLKLYNDGGDVTNHTDFARVRSVLVGEVTQRQIEYATLVSLDRTIIVNSNDDRLGEVYDPDGLVSACIAHPDVGQLTTSTIVSFEELKHENPPLFRERQNVFQPTALTHPFDTEEQALIRYTVTPVFDVEETETETLLGVIVSGDIVDGKVPITYDTVSVFESGIASVYGYDPTYFVPSNATEKQILRARKYWVASSMLAFDLSWTGMYDISNTQSLVDGIGYSATSNFVPESMLDESLRRKADKITTADSDEFVFATKPIPMGNYWEKMASVYDEDGSFDAAQTPVGFLVRGAIMGPDEKGEILTSSFGMVLIFCGTMIALFDFVCIFGSIFLFIAPLEKLAQRVLRKKKIRPHHAKSIQRKSYMIIAIILIAMCSIWPSVYFYGAFTSGMQDALERKSQQELGVGTIMYALKVDQMGFEFSGVAKNGAIRDLLQYPDDVHFQALTQEALFAEVKARKIEYATLVDNKMKVVWSPNNNGMKVINGTWQATENKGVVGDDFNPFGLVKDVLETGNRYQITELLEWAILEGEHAPVQKEKLDHTLVNSKLHPSKTEDLALIRYAATPVYDSSNLDTTLIDSDGRVQNILPDGVLIAGDIVNGKTVINERIIEVLGTGYAAVYAYNDKCEEFFLVSSVYNPHATETTSKDTDGLQETDNEVDVALSEGLARSLLRPVLRRGGKNTVWGKLPNGISYAFSAKLVAPNERISPTAGSTAYPLSANFAYIVYGSPVKEMEGLIKEQEILLGVLIALQCVKVVVIALLCFFAYRPMFKILGTMKVYSINTNEGVSK